MTIIDKFERFKILYGLKKKSYSPSECNLSIIVTSHVFNNKRQNCYYDVTKEADPPPPPPRQNVGLYIMYTLL